MIPEKKYSSIRIRNIVIMIAAVFVLVTGFKHIFNLNADLLIINLFIITFYFLLFIFSLAYNRINGLIHANMSEKYSELMICFIIATGIIFASSFFPPFTCPILIIAVFLSLVSNVQIGMMTGCFLDVIYCLNIRHSFYEMICYLLLTILGCILMQAFTNEKMRLYVNIIVFSSCMILPGIFYYLENYSVSRNLFIYSAVIGLISDLLLLIIFDRIYHITVNIEERSSLEIINESFPLVQEIKKYSISGYRHAVSVSQLCYKCAEIANLDCNTAASAGFYYQLGRLEGDTTIDNVVELAQINCFPHAVINILYEYNGEKRLPSTPESALVNMVDAIVTRFEQVTAQTKSSDWNRNILIYQTMNDKSSSGIYDKSGLSINQYLKIREFLVRGDDL